MTEKLGILAIGHGSKLPYNKEVVTKIADYIAKKHSDVIIRAGFMENSQPTLEEAIESFSGTGVTKVAAVPVFLASGVHITKDIPQILSLDESGCGILEIDGKEIPVCYAKPLGADELIADLVFKRVQEAL
ncbi:MAG: sirohydrochlorin nickelochelatase [Methanosarcina sp.]|jgi:sirohydrochlorin cobaltochelatase|nr:sirohydrochlorin nickelochelatase [Methanosarcina sp.]MDD3317041.1 sirohydrochlorin nickelochelatase [Methanosarcina sp.]MDD4304985.1 sirohydrochlorin nickelochelatase [Methanosarcina sp.]MDD4619539.1 sirohydrochlorin nickelochelatase [Methanosarcina sp.]NLN43265.1 sirohydrochlorin nickelochelatase [Methanosarcina sp.]